MKKRLVRYTIRGKSYKICLVEKQKSDNKEARALHI